MSIIYQRASAEQYAHLRSVMDEHHPELSSAGVTIDYLIAADGDAPEDAEPRSVVKHGGCPAYAKIKVVGLKDRAKGCADAEMIVDEATAINAMTEAELSALIDHELTHLVLKIGENDAPEKDDLGRPCLKTRMHDHEIGWFDEVAERHGVASVEFVQARKLLSSEPVRQVEMFRERTGGRAEITAALAETVRDINSAADAGA